MSNELNLLLLVTFAIYRFIYSRNQNPLFDLLILILWGDFLIGFNFNCCFKLTKNFQRPSDDHFYTFSFFFLHSCFNSFYIIFSKSLYSILSIFLFNKDNLVGNVCQLCHCFFIQNDIVSNKTVQCAVRFVLLIILCFI